MKVLSTKTLDAETLAYAASHNIDIQCIDFINLDGVAFDIGSVDHAFFDSVAFTSANGVKYFMNSPRSPGLLRGKKIYSLAGKTAEMLSRFSIDAISSGDSAFELATAIVNSGQAKAVLHVTGNLKITDLEILLNKYGIRYKALEVYQTSYVNQAIRSNDLDAIMFYSPSGVDSFLLDNKLNAAIICCCIGDTTADFLRSRNNEVKIILPARPSPEAMIKAIAQHFHITE